MVFMSLIVIVTPWQVNLFLGWSV